MPKKKTSKTKSSKTKTFMETPRGYVVTGLVLWALGYYLYILAIDSGSLLVYLAMVVAFGWGLKRVIEGIRLHIKR